jgi:sugar phosphate isomerase/epimerase
MTPQFSIASYSFHRLLAAGQQDMFSYIQTSKDLGMVQLDPWIGHLQPLVEEDKAIKGRGGHDDFSPAAYDYVAKVRHAIDASGLPLACLAVDGAHIYEPTPEARAVNRASARRWLKVAQALGARQFRIDTGGTAEMPDEMFQTIVAGYRELIQEVHGAGLELLMENHWGANNVPANVVKVLEAVPGLGLLFDTNNWIAGAQEEGWATCAKYAKSVHVKAFQFDAQGNEPTVDLAKVVKLLVNEGYQGVWGIETVPTDGDELGAVQKTKALLERILGA